MVWYNRACMQMSDSCSLELCVPRALYISSAVLIWSNAAKISINSMTFPWWLQYRVSVHITLHTLQYLPARFLFQLTTRLVYHSRCTQQYPGNFQENGFQLISGRHSSGNIQFTLTILSSEIVLHRLSPAAATEVRRIQPPSSKWWELFLRVYAAEFRWLDIEHNGAGIRLQLLETNMIHPMPEN